MNRLEEILLAKRDEIERLKPRIAELDRQAQARQDFRSLRKSLEPSDEKLAVIAEVKKASPSAGGIVETFDPVVIAKNYERSGADAILVLTATKIFLGSLGQLRKVSMDVSLPLVG